MSLSEMPIVQLSNGLLVGNLTSGHTFEFVDGTVLAACQQDRVDAGRLDIAEYCSERRIHRDGKVLTYTMVELTPTLQPAITRLLNDAREAYLRNEVHIVLVPLMLLEAIKAHKWSAMLDMCYAIRKEGRDSGGQRAKILIDKFCG